MSYLCNRCISRWPCNAVKQEIMINFHIWTLDQYRTFTVSKQKKSLGNSSIGKWCTLCFRNIKREGPILLTRMEKLTYHTVSVLTDWEAIGLTECKTFEIQMENHHNTENRKPNKQLHNLSMNQCDWTPVSKSNWLRSFTPKWCGNKKK